MPPLDAIAIVVERLQVTSNMSELPSSSIFFRRLMAKMNPDAPPQYVWYHFRQCFHYDHSNSVFIIICNNKISRSYKKQKRTACHTRAERNGVWVETDSFLAACRTFSVDGPFWDGNRDSSSDTQWPFLLFKLWFICYIDICQTFEVHIF